MRYVTKRREIIDSEKCKRFQL